MMTNGFNVNTVEGRGIKLAMQRLWLTGQILPVGARLLVRHDFASDEEGAAEVVYAFMLPRDAALRRFEVEGNGFKVRSELRPAAEATRIYEQGVDAGHLATLAAEHGDGIVNLAIGNLRKGEPVSVTLDIVAGVEMRDDGLRFRFPFTLAPGYHSRMNAIDLGDHGEMELPSDVIGDAILPVWRRDDSALHEIGFDLSLRIPGSIVEISSPSHNLRMRETTGCRRVSLARSADVPNRDLVLDVQYEPEQTETGASAPILLPGDGRFALVVPSTTFGTAPSASRRLAILIDRSGSMRGEPIAQARRAAEACLSALGPDDRFVLAAFENSTEVFEPTQSSCVEWNDVLPAERRLAAATAENRKAAAAWLEGIDARGGTELAKGFTTVASLVTGGDVLVLTDGQVMGASAILAEARAAKVRIHTLGIGSASQDRFLAQLASASGGVGRFVTARERVDLAAVDLFASIGRPVAVDLRIDGAEFAIDPPTAVFAGTPLVAFGEAAPGASVALRWRGGSMSMVVPQPQSELAENVRLLDGARRIVDIESRMTDAQSRESESALADLSRSFGLASRAISLVAVVEREGDTAGELPKTQVVPIGMPVDVAYDSYFRGAPAACLSLHRRAAATTALAKQAACCIPASYSPAIMRPCLKEESERAPQASEVAVAAESNFASDALLNLATQLEPDGGLRGDDPDDRALRTACALMMFLMHGHTPAQGALRAHVERMVTFLESITALPLDRRELLDRAIAFVRAARTPSLQTKRPKGIKARLVAAMSGTEGARNPEMPKTWDELERIIEQS
jgi:hypothetical protein